MVKYVKTEKGYIDASIFAPAQFKPAGKSYLTFSSPKNFTLAVNNKTKNWDGILEYFSADKTWTIWDGTTILFADNNDGEYVLYLRGTGNTKITGGGTNINWIITGTDVKCVGNIENLLDYITVESGNHPTMTTNCYSCMFQDCTSLTQAPVLPATTLAGWCYSSMFSGCTALTRAPKLPATTLSDYCYDRMFSSCTSLTKAPSLPATTLSARCYIQMFQCCTSLTQAPELPATTLANYCYFSMFYGCTSLTKAPDLPATTLVKGCYGSMFQGCTALTQAPALPATTLERACYRSMFQDCTSLKLSSTKTGEYTQEYRIPSSGTGTTGTYALTDMFKYTGGTFTMTPEINTTYYLSTDNMIVRDTEIATLNGYVGSMIDNSVSNPLNINGAAVGQIAKITAVDESGKPTAWEAVDMPSGGGHWETVLDTVWEQDVIHPTAFDSETGIFTCAEGELNNLALNTEYAFYQQCDVEGVAYNTILGDENLKVTKLSDTTFSIDVTPPTTFVPTNVKFSKGACLAITDIDAKKIRLTLDGQFKPTATLYDKPFYGMNVPFFGRNTGYQQIRNAYHAYQQVTAEVESPYRIVGELLCGFNAPSKNPSFHFKNNSFCCPLFPYDVPEGNQRKYFLTSDGTKIAKLYSTYIPWNLGGVNENISIGKDLFNIISGTKVKLERWVE